MKDDFLAAAWGELKKGKYRSAIFDLSLVPLVPVSAAGIRSQRGFNVTRLLFVSISPTAYQRMFVPIRQCYLEPLRRAAARSFSDFIGLLHLLAHPMNPTLIGSGVWWDQGTGQILIPGFSAAVCVWQKGIGSSI
jgi:hypothetical protein